MRSNYLQGVYGITTFGESHSKAVGVVIEDVKPGIQFPLQDIQDALDKRKPGTGNFTSSRKEPDKLEILSGVYEGQTTGMPICLVVYNKNAQSENYKILKNLFRPGHADLAYFKKFKIFDHRGGGRASGRETLSRVIAGEMTNPLLKGISIKIYPLKIGKIEIDSVDVDFIDKNPLSWPCPYSYNKITDYLENIKSNRDSTGGMLQVVITNIPAGLGDPVFEKLDANLSKAIMSIGSIKGIEFGSGFELAQLKGSEANQPLLSISPSKPSTAGGIYGGITTGEPVIFRLAIKPTPSIGIPQTTVNRDGETSVLKMKGRFDTCIIPRIIPVVKAMIKLVLADAISYQNLIKGKQQNLGSLREAIDKLDEDILIALARRKKIAQQIKAYKKEHHIESYQPAREEKVLTNILDKSKELNLDKGLVRGIWKKIFEDNRGKI